MDYFKINISNDLWNKPFIQATIQSNPILPKLFQLFNLIPNVHYQLQLSFYYLESSLFERLHSIGTIGHPCASVEAFIVMQSLHRALSSRSIEQLGRCLPGGNGPSKFLWITQAIPSSFPHCHARAHCSWLWKCRPPIESPLTIIKIAWKQNFFVPCVFRACTLHPLILLSDFTL